MYVNSAVTYANDSQATLANFALTGSNRMLIVCVTRIFASNDVPDDVTINGVSLTPLDVVTSGSGRTFYFGESSLPANGSYDIVADYTTEGADDTTLAAALMDNCVDQAPESSTLVSDNTGQTSFAITDDTLTDNAQVVAFAAKRFSEDIAFSGESWVEQEQILDTASAWVHTLDDAGAAPNTMNYNGSYSPARDYIVGIVILESTAAPVAGAESIPVLQIRRRPGRRMRRTAAGVLVPAWCS